ncbi:MAG: 2-oxoglutarate dehydrogenase E1 component [Bacteroidota bacterium]|nr:2-oxoglutarate dehydrogenase E1 component [Bacteroidota bacterium]
MLPHSYISNADVNYIDDLYKQYQSDKESIEYGWQKFFEGFDFGVGKTGTGSANLSEDTLKEINVLNLINAYRTRGHLFTKTNPVRERRTYTPTLALSNFGLSEADLNTVYNAGNDLGIGAAKLSDIVQHLKTTYCESIGAEYMHIGDPIKIEWLRHLMETTKNIPNLNIEEKKQCLNKLNQATAFENFLHTKFIGQKRFSLEGLECLIPALDSVIHYGAELGVQEFVMGMAHRGRLNVLANIFNKTYSDIFSEFEGKVFQDEQFEGDVKYHLGYTTLVKTYQDKEVKLKLAPNPSHLEAVNPVVKGIVRAKLDHVYEHNINKICPILIHGDAAIAGQGIVYEVVQMSGLEANNIGGTMHIVTNNQIGFTTNYTDSRTSIYCTDVAKTTNCPIFHVNGDDVEAVVHTIKMAMAYRNKFNCDVFIDLLGYRKYGHNEGDEPRFTQPLLYKLISSHPNPREIYKDKLIARGDIDASIAQEMEEKFKDLLQITLDDVKQNKAPESKPKIEDLWKDFHYPTDQDFIKATDTSFKEKRWIELCKIINTIPDNNLPIKKVQQLYQGRLKQIENNQYDWAMGEMMAYATLLDEGHSVRLSGQDCERGTFSHRHALIKKEDSETEFIPLQHISPKQGEFNVYNSLLSEYAALGFEYGYSVTTPNDLTIWEAQFGDFGNGAQIMIDQFIASASTKWAQFSGLVMMLPHGYEGQGPEHSSARLERFLQLCASNNMQVVNCTTPANYYHVLRRQLKRKDFRVPLIAMTPKSLLRHPLCVSQIEDFTKGSFQEIIHDTYVDAKKVRRVILCSGKLYYDLLEKQQSDKAKDVAIVRIEQLFPLPEKQLADLYQQFSKAEFVWAQEEPKNMGTWMHFSRYDLPFTLRYIGRKSSASPATGYKKVHDKEQAAILNEAFA